MPWLIVGLGNPGPSYSAHRHNIGFMVVDELARRMGERFSDKFKGRVARGRLGEDELTLLEPQTFMNLSGTSVAAAASFYKFTPERVIVVHDELDLPFAQVRVKVSGGHAGHNGLRSIFAHYGPDFVRVRCGIGRPVHGDVSGYVLSEFARDEQPGVGQLVDDAAEAVALIVARGPLEAMNAIHPQQKRKGSPTQ